jgi:two-component system sensor histidine kinase PrrB
VTGRFVRGRSAAPGGSGLGLALVAQQAALHGGRLSLLDSPSGGLRAVLELAAVALADR